MNIVIYGLCDPRTGRIRYVGKAVNIRVRTRQHSHSPEKNHGNPKAQWIRSLLAIGMKPLVVLLEESSESQWGSAEQHWINRLRTLGENLTNSTAGGAGGPWGRKCSDETRDKMRRSAASRRGIPRTEEVRRKCREAALRPRYISDETRARISEKAIGRELSMTPQFKIRREAWLTASRHKAIAAQIATRKAVIVKQEGASSKFNGVSKYRGKKWAVTLKNIPDKPIHVGYFDSEIDAARAFNEAVVKHGKPSTWLNDIAS